MRGNRYSYVCTFLGHQDSHGPTGKRIGYQWFVIDRTQRAEESKWLPWKIIRRCYTRAEARELCKALNERGFITLEVVRDDKRIIS